jgi:hypothetical protein
MSPNRELGERPKILRSCLGRGNVLAGTTSFARINSAPQDPDMYQASPNNFQHFVLMFRFLRDGRCYVTASRH